MARGPLVSGPQPCRLGRPTGRPELRLAHGEVLVAVGGVDLTAAASGTTRAVVNRHRLGLILALTLVSTAAGGEEGATVADRVESVEAGYRSLGASRYQLSLAVRHEAGPFEVGWQVIRRRYAPDDLVVTGEQVTIGALWAWSAVRGRAGGLRFRLDPWAAVYTNLHETSSQAIVTLPYGAESSVLLYGSIRLGRTLHVSPNVGLVANLARSTRSMETVIHGSDWRTGLRVALPLWLGSPPRLKLEASYFRSRHAGSYFGQEETAFSMAWAF